MNKIKVMHLIHQLGAGGAENGIINLINNINTDLFSTAVCCFLGKGHQTHRLSIKRTTLFEIGKGKGNDLILPIKLYRLFRCWKPDIVHTHAWGTLCEGLSAAKAALVPVVIHGEHGTIQQKRPNILVQRMVWRIADQIVSVSHDHAQQMSKTIGFPLNKIKVLNNGVDCDRFGSTENIDLIREGLKLRNDDIAIGTVGRLVPVKNQKMLIQSFALLTVKYPHIKLIFAGEGPLKNDLKHLAEKLGCLSKIQFLGRRSDIPDIMSALDIFALTSYSEGMSNTILEAMSSSIPVVATEVGGNPELVVNNKTGLLVPSNNRSKMIEAFELLIKNPDIRARMGKAGRARVENHFSLQTMVKNYELLYSSCYKKN